MREKPNFHQICHDDAVKHEIIRTFECIRGMTPVCFGDNANLIFELIRPIFEDSVNLMKMYENYMEIIAAILEMYVDVVEVLLCVLNQVRTNTLYYLTFPI